MKVAKRVYNSIHTSEYYYKNKFLIHAKSCLLALKNIKYKNKKLFYNKFSYCFLI